MNATVLVIGDTGLLGQALMRELTIRGWTHRGLSRRSTDIPCDVFDSTALNAALSLTNPGIIINSAGLINIAACETSPGTAWLANARLPMQLASYCQKAGCYLIQISTDHYFSDDGLMPHDEDAPTECINEYARSKLAGEILASSYDRSLIVRTNIVGFRRSETPTFVEWAIQNLEKQQPVTLFTDFFTSSISTTQFSTALIDILEKRPFGRLNLAAREGFSKHDFIQALARACGLPATCCQKGLLSDHMQTRRANSLVLNVGRAESLLGRPLPTLLEVVEQLATEYHALKRQRGYSQ